MDLKSIALIMLPYWILGAFVLLATYLAGQKEVIRVQKSSVLGFIRFLGIITFYRVVLFKFFHGHFEESAKNISIIPWPLTLTVFWEDACHGLPLYLLRKWIGTDKWWKWLIHGPLLAMVMLEFGLGHVYQGVFAACLLSLYVPYSIKMGEKHGFGTVMVCHTLFDLATILTMKAMFGA